MGQFCLRCGKKMKHHELTHCSDECLLADMKDTRPANEEHNGSDKWGEESDPWV